MTEHNKEVPVFQICTEPTRVDALVVFVRGVLGPIPVLGSLMAEIVGAIIPNQRVDRIARVVVVLAEKVAGLEQERVEERLKTPEGVDLLEDGFHQAARALSDERLEYIANILRSGITEEQAKMAEKKRLMWLLGQLDDAEIIMLTGCSMLERDEEFEKRHWSVLEPRDYYGGMPDDEAAKVSLDLSRKHHMCSLGLLPPLVDNGVGTEATPLGRLLVKTVTGGLYGNW